MKRNLVIASFVLSFSLAASFANISLNHMVSAQDLSSIKDQATNLLSGNNNNGSTSSNLNSTSNNFTSGDSSLTQRATDSIGGMLN